jgi:spermidine synthase/MFS family permease
MSAVAIYQPSSSQGPVRKQLAASIEIPRLWRVGPAVWLGLVSVWSNLALLVLQQVSFRLLAPTIGSSLETWSTIVGVFLLGIAAGNAVGGRLADRYSPGRLVRWGLLAGCGSALGMVWISEALKVSTWMAAWPLSVQILTAAGVVCFLPAFLLSLLTPVAVRGVMSERFAAGSAAGLIYALGTAGSLIGNYATGFWMIPHYAIGEIVLMVAVSLWVLALVVPAKSARMPADTPDITGATSERRAYDIGNDTTVAEATPSDAPLAGRLVLAATIVCLCSFVSGTLESAAFRILAPLVGVSIYLSTGVVGVVLCGIAVGNYWGGRLADRRGGFHALRWTIGLAAIATLLVVPLLRNTLDAQLLDSWPLIPRIVGWSFLLFFVPSLLLGMISPQVIRLAVARADDAGRIAGLLYAWSTLGCIAGILTTAWCLIEWFGVQRLVMACGFSLLPMLVFASRDSLSTVARRHAWTGLVGGVVVVAYLVQLRSPYALETRYFSIAVLDAVREGRPVKELVLDRLVHSTVDLNDPSWLGYKHEETQGAITRNLAVRPARSAQPLQLLVIGGGGYTYPKWVENQPDLTHVGIDVVEIDPGVTEIAYRELGLSRETRIRSFNLDGRQFVKQAGAGRYGLIIQDAVNDFSVPYHLMTREYNDLVRQALTEDGVYLLTVIDSVSKGRFLPAALRTMQASFGDVRLLALRDHGQDGSRSLFILAGRKSRANETSSEAESKWGEILGEKRDRMLSEADVQALLDNTSGAAVTLTDAYAPVDTLMSGAYLGGE